MKPTTWLEVVINGPWSRTRQPKMSVLADEIVEAPQETLAEIERFLKSRPMGSAA